MAGGAVPLGDGPRARRPRCRRPNVGRRGGGGRLVMDFWTPGLLDCTRRATPPPPPDRQTEGPGGGCRGPGWRRRRRRPWWWWGPASRGCGQRRRWRRCWAPGGGVLSSLRRAPSWAGACVTSAGSPPALCSLGQSFSTETNTPCSAISSRCGRLPAGIPPLALLPHGRASSPRPCPNPLRASRPQRWRQRRQS